MTLHERVTATTGEWAQADKPIVVAVDGSERNRSAVAWAAAEAAATGGRLTLVTAVEDHFLPTPHFSIRGQEKSALDMLTDLRHEVRHLLAEHRVAVAVVTGSAVEVLLDRSRDAHLVVVGKRGLGGFARVLAGSTSIAVAGRATAPVSIVPDIWNQEDHAEDPIVLGVDPYRPDEHIIGPAFRRARRLGVPLVAVHGWETPSMYSWDAAAIAGTVQQWEEASHAAFDRVLDGWRERFPDVELRAVRTHTHPAAALLDAAKHAQLVILGRHTDGRLGGFALGSITRAVLHYADCPVMVVPTGRD